MEITNNNVDAKIYTLNLHDELSLNGYSVMRVPDGWIYRFWDYEKREYGNAVFVPDLRK